MSLHNVEAIALDVRYWAEGRAPDEQYDLNGWCAIASAQLFRQLKARGIEAEIHAWTCNQSSDAHVYIVVADHVVDVTATQFARFRNKPVVVMHYREAQSFEYYQTVAIFHSVEELRNWQKGNRWPSDQVAYSQ